MRYRYNDKENKTMKLRKDIEEFIDVIKKNDNIKHIEIEIYNYTIRESELFTRIEDFDFLYETKWRAWGLYCLAAVSSIIEIFNVDDTYIIY